ncbi:MAG: hypothetical protein R2861_08370 [Desulfobacterales bacterium]
MERVMILAGSDNRVTADTLSFLRQGPDGCGIFEEMALPPEGISWKNSSITWQKKPWSRPAATRRRPQHYCG